MRPSARGRSRSSGKRQSPADRLRAERARRPAALATPRRREIGRRIARRRAAFADAVPRQEEPPPPPIPDSEGEHSAQPGQTIDTPLLVGADDRFRIRARAEAVAQALKLSAEMLEVVDLAVECDPYVAARVRHRLAARFGKVDDRKAAVPQRATPVRPDAPGVRAAMSLGVDHRPQARLERSAGI